MQSAQNVVSESLSVTHNIDLHFHKFFVSLLFIQTVHRFVQMLKIHSNRKFKGQFTDLQTVNPTFNNIKSVYSNLFEKRTC